MTAPCSNEGTSCGFVQGGKVWPLEKVGIEAEFGRLRFGVINASIRKELQLWVSLNLRE